MSVKIKAPKVKSVQISFDVPTQELNNDLLLYKGMKPTYKNNGVVIEGEQQDAVITYQSVKNKFAISFMASLLQSSLSLKEDEGQLEIPSKINLTTVKVGDKFQAQLSNVDEN